jgi:hypothetical protein
VKRLDHIGSNEPGNGSFWSDEAALHDHLFKVVPFEESLCCAFEVCPSLCLERNGGEMPFGCHALALYLRGFREEGILKEGQQTAGKHHPAILTT